MSLLFPILIIGLAAAAEEGWRLDPLHDYGMRGWPAAAIACGSVLLIWLWQWMLTRLSMKRIAQGGGLRYLDLADLSLIAAQWSIIAAYAAALFVFGWGATVQGWMGGDLIAVDLLITALPPIAGLCGTWWIHEPVIRRLRDASMIRAFDEARPVHRPPTRLAYTFLQARLNLLFLLVPLVLIVTAGDIIDELVPISKDGANFYLNQGLTMGCALGIFTIAPFFARLILNLHSMPQGEVRDDLFQVCRDHRVRVRDVLLWDTHGGMINAAVMGIVGWVRYVMITDALLESLRRDEVIAVMAHEVGHVRRWHMPWLAVCIFAVVLVPSLLAYIVSLFVDMRWVEDVGTFAAVGAAVPAFGWISRRFERQADTFAVQHLSGLRAGDRSGQAQMITPDAAATMAGALESVAQLNGMNPRRKSWRHGSIRWRQDYLHTIVGRPIHALPIDRQVRTIKLAALALLIGSIVAGTAIEYVVRGGAAPSGALSAAPREAEYQRH